MGKGDDDVRRKRNKAQRKRLRQDSAVSSRVASLIAAKRRRKAGKRRICQGMCFSVPSQDDPFNDRFDQNKDANGKLDESALCKADSKLSSKRKKPLARETDPANVLEEMEAGILKKLKGGNSNIKDIRLAHSNGTAGETAEEKPKGLNGSLKNGLRNANVGNTCSLSKFVMLCLCEIQKSWMLEGVFDAEKHKPLIANGWGIQFWNTCSGGSSVLEITKPSTSREQVAWVASTASDIVSEKEKDGTIFSSPFLLYLVSSQEVAVKVRSICKPLKALGIHTVSLHDGAALDHQVHGLRSCEPEFLVATPERLLELVSSKDIDITGVSLLVVDGLEEFVSLNLGDVIKTVKQHIQGDPQTVVFTSSYGKGSSSIIEHIFGQPFRRLKVDNNKDADELWIKYKAHVLVSENGENKPARHLSHNVCYVQVRRENWVMTLSPRLLGTSMSE